MKADVKKGWKIYRGQECWQGCNYSKFQETMEKEMTLRKDSGDKGFVDVGYLP